MYPMYDTSHLAKHARRDASFLKVIKILIDEYCALNGAHFEDCRLTVEVYFHHKGPQLSRAALSVRRTTDHANVWTESSVSTLTETHVWLFIRSRLSADPHSRQILEG